MTKKKPISTKERAQFWGVELRVMQMWVKEGKPVDDPEKMIAWYSGLSLASQQRLSDGFKRKVFELTGTKRDEVKTSAPSALSMGDQTVIATLKLRFEHYLKKESECETIGDKAGVAEATRQIKELGSIIHDMELRAQKLGKDLGDLVPRTSLESAARFVGYHLMRCADEVIEQATAALISQDVTGVKLSAEEVRAALEPIILSHYVMQPIVRASEGDNAAAPPDWLVAALRDGMNEVLEPAT